MRSKNAPTLGVAKRRWVSLRSGSRDAPSPPLAGAPRTRGSPPKPATYPPTHTPPPCTLRVQEIYRHLRLGLSALDISSQFHTVWCAALHLPVSPSISLDLPRSPSISRCGDLNYRIDHERDAVLKLVRQKACRLPSPPLATPHTGRSPRPMHHEGSSLDPARRRCPPFSSLQAYRLLYDKYDQLRAEMRSDRVFYGFQASSPPTSPRPTCSRAISSRDRSRAILRSISPSISRSISPSISPSISHDLAPSAALSRSRRWSSRRATSTCACSLRAPTAG